MKTVSPIALTLMIAVTTLHAQDGSRRLTLDAVFGSGPRTQHAGTVWYRGEETPYGRLALAFQAPLTARLGVLVTLDRAGSIETGDHLTDCPPAPDGSCRRYFPPLSAWSTGVGMRAGLLSGVELGLLGGFGVRGVRGEFARVDLGVRATRHVAGVAGIEYRVARRSDGTRLWWRPVFAGIRLR